jgi:hypothetical protein
MDDYQKGIHIFCFDYTWEVTNQKHGCVHATIGAIRFRGLGLHVHIHLGLIFTSFEEKIVYF